MKSTINLNFLRPTPEHTYYESSFKITIVGTYYLCSDPREVEVYQKVVEPKMRNPVQDMILNNPGKVVCYLYYEVMRGVSVTLYGCTDMITLCEKMREDYDNSSFIQMMGKPDTMILR